MLAESITCTKFDGTTTEVFDLISSVGTRSIRAVAGLELDEPRELEIAHETVKSKSRTNTLVGITATTDVGSAEVPELATSRVFMKISYDHRFTAAQVKDLVREVESVLTDANLVKLLNRES